MLRLIQILLFILIPTLSFASATKGIYSRMNDGIPELLLRWTTHQGKKQEEKAYVILSGGLSKPHIAVSTSIIAEGPVWTPIEHFGNENPDSGFFAALLDKKLQETNAFRTRNPIHISTLPQELAQGLLHDLDLLKEKHPHRNFHNPFETPVRPIQWEPAVEVPHLSSAERVVTDIHGVQHLLVRKNIGLSERPEVLLTPESFRTGQVYLATDVGKRTVFFYPDDSLAKIGKLPVLSYNSNITHGKQAWDIGGANKPASMEVGVLTPPSMTAVNIDREVLNPQGSMHDFSKSPLKERKRVDHVRLSALSGLDDELAKYSFSRFLKGSLTDEEIKEFRTLPQKKKLERLLQDPRFVNLPPGRHTQIIEEGFQFTALPEKLSSKTHPKLTAMLKNLDHHLKKNGILEWIGGAAPLDMLPHQLSIRKQAGESIPESSEDFHANMLAFVKETLDRKGYDIVQEGQILYPLGPMMLDYRPYLLARKK